MHNLGFVNNQGHIYNPVYHHHPGYVQAYNMLYPAFGMYNSTYYNPCGCGNCKPQAYNDMYNPFAGTRPDSDPYKKYSNENENQDHHVGSPNEMQNCENQDHHVGSPNEMRNCENQDHHHLQAVGLNKKVSLRKRMFKLVGQLSVGVLSSIIFGASFPNGLS